MRSFALVVAGLVALATAQRGRDHGDDGDPFDCDEVESTDDSSVTPTSEATPSETDAGQSFAAATNDDQPAQGQRAKQQQPQQSDDQSDEQQTQQGVSATASVSVGSGSGGSSGGGSAGGRLCSDGGEATFYSQNGVAGHCGNVNPDSANIVALPSATFSMDLCGKTVSIKNLKTGQVVDAIVADSCPTCISACSIDLSVGLFQNVFGVPASDGIFPVEFTLPA